MKKLLVLALALAVAMSMIFACKTADQDKDKDKVKDDAKDKKEVVNNGLQPNQTTTTQIELNPNVKVKFDSEEYDFGEVLEGDKVKHAYEITNTGKELLKIHDVRTSCGCTALTGWPKEN